MGRTPIMRSALPNSCTTLAALIVVVTGLVLSIGFVLRTDSGRFGLMPQAERTVICNCTTAPREPRSSTDVPLKLPAQMQLVENPEDYVTMTCRGAYNDTLVEETRTRKR